MNGHNDKLISMQEFAEILGIQVDTLYKKYRRHPEKFPSPVHPDILKEKKFLYSDVMDWLKSGKA